MKTTTMRASSSSGDGGGGGDIENADIDECGGKSASISQVSIFGVHTHTLTYILHYKQKVLTSMLNICLFVCCCSMSHLRIVLLLLLFAATAECCRHRHFYRHCFVFNRSHCVCPSASGEFESVFN